MKEIHSNVKSCFQTTEAVAMLRQQASQHRCWYENGYGPNARIHLWRLFLKVRIRSQPVLIPMIIAYLLHLISEKALLILKYEYNPVIICMKERLLEVCKFNASVLLIMKRTLKHCIFCMLY
jgi:hypothetical protein